MIQILTLTEFMLNNILLKTGIGKQIAKTYDNKNGSDYSEDFRQKNMRQNNATDRGYKPGNDSRDGRPFRCINYICSFSVLHR